MSGHGADFRSPPSFACILDGIRAHRSKSATSTNHWAMYSSMERRQKMQSEDNVALRSLLIETQLSRSCCCLFSHPARSCSSKCSIRRWTLWMRKKTLTYLVCIFVKHKMKCILWAIQQGAHSLPIQPRVVEGKRCMKMRVLCKYLICTCRHVASTPFLTFCSSCCKSRILAAQNNGKVRSNNGNHNRRHS